LLTVQNFYNKLAIFSLKKLLMLYKIDCELKISKFK